jgi:hypothetical protein
MGVVLGFVIGYVMGTRDGETGFEELKEAWHTIRTSDEARNLVNQGMSFAKSLLAQGSGMLSDRLQGNGPGGTISALRPTG